MYYLGSRNPLTLIVLAALLLGGGIAAKSWMAAQPEIVAEEFITARVVAVEKVVSERRDKVGGMIRTEHVIAEVDLGDGRTFKTRVQDRSIDHGDMIEVKVVTYSDGTHSGSAAL